jgi:hypothetical protein
MGLDVSASRCPDDVALTREDRAVFASLDLPLCEWIGDGSFRGKVYIGIVAEVAGVCLHEGWMPPEEVREIAAAFESCDPEKVSERSLSSRYLNTADEVRALTKLFKVCADRRLGLIGW